MIALHSLTASLKVFSFLGNFSSFFLGISGMPKVFLTAGTLRNCVCPMEMKLFVIQ